MILDYLDDDFGPIFGLPLKHVTGKPVTEVLKTLGGLLESLALDVLRESIIPGRHPVEFTDQRDRRRVMTIRTRRMTRYFPVSISPEHGPVTAVAFQFIEIPDRIPAAYQEAVFHGIIGRSASMNELFDRLQVYGPADAPVIITGETGTGKELVARAIHDLSLRRNEPFVAVNCTALNEELFESELFGHEKGAFTGAARQHKGRFERADGGTLFLDEIGDMPERTQAKLLRVLEEKTFERVGGESEIIIDVRILAATNISLEQAVARNLFRSDLYHRMAVLRIHVPPLRDRQEDIPLLVRYFLDNLNRRYGKNIVRLSPDAMRLLQEYRWPGNIRELRNVLERVYVETHGSVIGRNAFREWIKERDYLAASQWNLQLYETQQLTRTPIVPPLGRRIPDGEPGFMPHSDTAGIQAASPAFPARRHLRALPAGTIPDTGWINGEFHETTAKPKEPGQLSPESLARAFGKAGGNISLASRILGIHKATFYRYMKKFSLPRSKLEILSGSPAKDQPDSIPSS
ncbi:sigma-54-dependent Fis family transcriptional regulator [bacterium]|nr:sigma-54-dependent Fis family transcriptional regulator [candidate division CSSED10-310 bacterium]